MLVLSALALIGYAAAQSTASATDLQAVQANFQNAQLVPQLIPDFTPQGTLGVTFGGQAITIGQKLAQTAVAAYPTLAVVPSSGGSRINAQSVYSVIMVDANPVGTDQNSTAQTRHWLVNTVSLSGSAPYAVNYTGSTPVTDYAGPGPFSGSGSHRYVVLLYAQSSSFSPPANLSTAGVPLGTMFLQQYINSTGLGPLVAANYFQVENGVSTVTSIATSAVNTATLSGSVSSSGTASRSASVTAAASGSGSMSGTVSASGAAATTSRAAAGKKESLGWGLIIGAVGVVGTVIGAGLGL